MSSVLPYLPIVALRDIGMELMGCALGCRQQNPLKVRLGLRFSAVSAKTETSEDILGYPGRASAARSLCRATPWCFCDNFCV